MPRIKEQALKADLAKRGFESVSIKRELPGGCIQVEANKLCPVHVEAGEDIVARIIGQYLSERLGQQFLIENKVGAAGNIGMAAVLSSPPDGYTIGFVSGELFKVMTGINMQHVPYRGTAIGGGLPVDYQLVFGGLLTGQIARFPAAQDAIDVGSGGAIELDAKPTPVPQ